MFNKHLKFIFILFTVLSFCGCAGLHTFVGGNNPEDKGSCPVNYEQAVNDHLKRALYDPYSIRDLSIGKPMASSCAIGVYGPFHGWRVSVTLNAKNRLGGYVGLKTQYYWFHSEQLVAVTDSPDSCSDIATARIH